MTTNREWLYSLEPDELTAWFDAEHVDANDVSTRKGDVRADYVCANDVDVSQDSREKLEADARALQTRIWQAGANSDGISLSHIIELLDRQAAITEEQTRCKWVTASADEIAAWRSKAEKLQAQLYELTAERDALADDLLTCNKEREEYRELFSEALTLAAEIVNLQP